RDFHVTGVQTCALPISEVGSATPDRALGTEDGRARGGVGGEAHEDALGQLQPACEAHLVEPGAGQAAARAAGVRRGARDGAHPRSEERRGGEDWWYPRP